MLSWMSAPDFRIQKLRVAPKGLLI